MNERINEKIGAWLLAPGNTQDALAADIGISRPTLRSRLRGDSKWMWDEVVALSAAISTPLDDLAGVASGAAA